MEEEDEIESHPSSPVINQIRRPQPLSSSPPVTVAAPPPSPPPPNPSPPNPHHHQTLTLALPIQQPRMNSGGGGGGGREDCWSEGATSTLIDAWGERYLELSRGNLKQKHWKDVADIVSSREDYTKLSKTDVQCKNRIDTLKKKYKIEKTKIVSGSGPSKWNFFNRLEHLIGPNSKIPAMPTTPTQGGKVPVGLRSFHQERNHQQLRRPQRSSKPSRYRMDSDSSKSEPADSPDSTDSFPPETTFNRKRPRFQRAPNSEPVRRAAAGSFRQSTTGKGNNNWGNSVMELTRAIMNFGEAYEQVETSKLQQVVEMEHQRMEFTKELELQRMQFFMNTQLELSQIKPARRAGNNSRRHNNNNANNNNNNNNSDNSGYC